MKNLLKNIIAFGIGCVVIAYNPSWGTKIIETSAMLKNKAIELTGKKPLNPTPPKAQENKEANQK